MNSGYAPALRRFWWVVAIGAIVAVFAAVLMIYSVEAGVPPKLTEREQPVYVAQARLLVNSGEAPYLRTAVQRFRQVPIGTGDQTAAVPVSETPDVSTLVDAANVYPLFIESDAVASLRSKMFGDLPGTVEAQAIFATATASRYRPSEIPVIVVNTSGTSEGAAVELASATSNAFRAWVVREQRRAGVEATDRILIQELQNATPIGVTGGTGLGIPIMALLAILTGFAAAAILLDRTYPRPGGAQEDDAAASERDDATLDRQVGISQAG